MRECTMCSRHVHVRPASSCKRGINTNQLSLLLLYNVNYGAIHIIERVVSAKLLGVTFCSNLEFDEHVKKI